MDLITDDEYTLTAKYLQIAHSIILEIESETLKVGDNIHQ